MSIEQLDAPAKTISSHGLEQLEVRLQGRLGNRIRNLQLSFQDRGIVLRGVARTYHAKQLAQHAVMTETPVPIVANEIEVT